MPQLSVAFMKNGHDYGYLTPHGHADVPVNPLRENAYVYAHDYVHGCVPYFHDDAHGYGYADADGCAVMLWYPLPLTMY